MNLDLTLCLLVILCLYTMLRLYSSCMGKTIGPLSSSGLHGNTTEAQHNRFDANK